MKRRAYCLFESALGWCGIAWSEQEDQPRVTQVHLPDATKEATESRMAASSGVSEASAPPPPIAQVIERVRKHLGGDLQDFRDVPLDLESSGEFARRVYDATRDIPAGQTRTYGQLAQLLNQPDAARAVGEALGRNPVTIIIPCHRVVAAGHKPGGFSAHGGRETKAKLLTIEGAGAVTQGWRGIHQLPLIPKT